MGHVDVLGASLVIACVWLLSVGRNAAAGGAAALAVLAKLVPLVALPLWWRSVRRRGQRMFAVGTAALLLPATIAVLLWTRGVPPGLVEYALRWEYNGPFYEPLWRLIGVLRLDLAASGVVHLVARVVFGGEVEATPWSIALLLRLSPVPRPPRAPGSPPPFSGFASGGGARNRSGLRSEPSPSFS